MAPSAQQRQGDKTAVTVRISLADATPVIWRRVVVPASITLASLHEVIQVSMGWENVHLYAFEVGARRFGPLDEESDEDEIDDGTVVLSEVVSAGDHLLYEYDFGDSWQHDIFIESIESQAEGMARPLCLEGERACPPEDSGGMSGYASVLTVLADPDHAEHADLVEWVGASFDPEAVDLVATNAALRRPH